MWKVVLDCCYFRGGEMRESHEYDSQEMAWGAIELENATNSISFYTIYWRPSLGFGQSNETGFNLETMAANHCETELEFHSPRASLKMI